MAATPLLHAGIVLRIRQRRQHALVQFDQGLTEFSIRDDVQVVVEHALQYFFTELFSGSRPGSITCFRPSITCGSAP